MGTSKNKKSSNKINPILSKGLKYLGIALPFLFIAPILVTIGFKSLKKDSSFLILTIGILLTLFSMIIVVQGIRIILKSLFDNED